jgi:hypothetical protein
MGEAMEVVAGAASGSVFDSPYAPNVTTVPSEQAAMSAESVFMMKPPDEERTGSPASLRPQTHLCPGYAQKAINNSFRDFPRGMSDTAYPMTRKVMQTLKPTVVQETPT